LEQEKVLSKHERSLINDILQDSDTKEQLFKCLKDFELGTNTKFAVRRLKALIHNNPTGLPVTGFDVEPDSHVDSDDQSSAKILPSKGVRKEKETGVAEKEDTIRTISKVFGDEPQPSILYAHPDSYNVTAKITKRLATAITSFGQQGGPPKFAVLIGSGSFNPLTRMHLRRYYVAKQYLETSHLGFTVLGCLLSPAHATSVREVVLYMFLCQYKV
jgi:hypothetical protein